MSEIEIEKSVQETSEEFSIEESLTEYVAAPSSGSAKSSSGQKWSILALVLFLVAVLAQLWSSGSETYKQHNANIAVSLSSLLKQSSSISTDAINGNQQAFGSLKAHHDDLQKGVDQFKKKPAGIAGLVAGLAPLNTSAIDANWNQISGLIQQVVGKQKDLESLSVSIDEISKISSTLANEAKKVAVAVKQEAKEKGKPEQERYENLSKIAALLVGLVDRIEKDAAAVKQGGRKALLAAQQMNENTNRFKEAVQRLRINSDKLVKSSLLPLETVFEGYENNIVQVGKSMQTYGKLSETNVAIENSSVQFQKQLAAVQDGQGSRILSNLYKWLPWLLAAASLLFMSLGRSMQTENAAISFAGADTTLAEQQEAILRLLDEMSALADGDLTIEAEVTDEITGAIADSVNFAVNEMRVLVSQINRASLEVGSGAQLAVQNAQKLSLANLEQADEINAASQRMEKVVNSMRSMSQNAGKSVEMATESVNMASQGAKAVRETIEGMDDMREQIQETSKRIKRLGESSQQIGDIVALIDDIAEQTNILSLNAAIQASMAGEAGRGFAVVSDEVQRLAERSTEATKRIAELVNTIQTDTNDAVLSMEKATREVVEGTRVADKAGKSLVEIEQASNQLSQIIAQMAQNAASQAEEVSGVSGQVSKVRDRSNVTSNEAKLSADSVGKLVELASELETSVSRFKLPESA